MSQSKLSELINDETIPEEDSAPGDFVAAVRDLEGTPEDVAIDLGQELADKAPLSDIVTDLDTWVLTTDFSGAANPIDSNLERYGAVEKKGDGVSESSGVFTFSKTGAWLVSAQFTMETNNFIERNYSGAIRYTANNGSTWTTISDGGQSTPQVSGVTRQSSPAGILLNITDTAQQKVAFRADPIDSNTLTKAVPFTQFQFLRLGEAVNED